MPIKKGTAAAGSGVAKKVVKKAAKKAVKKAVTKAAKPAAATAPKTAVLKPAAKSAAKKVAKKAAAKTSATTAAKKAAATKARARTRVADVAGDDEPAPAGGTALVIVESPAKAKTIGKYLGRGYTVRATVGHVRDLPAKKLGIDIEHGFAPDYVTIEGKEDILTDLKKIAKGAREIFIATDPDREGEAIGWHVEQYFTQPPRYAVTAPIRRVMFHEITKDKVQQSMANPMDIDNKKVDAQQARRVLDRLVGYKASPVLWKTVKKGLSAGRVQTVALRIIVEREREIRAFTPVEYWSIAADLQKGTQPFSAKLHQIDGNKPEISTAEQAERILADLKGQTQFTVTEVKRREKRKNPAAPFTTSTLQQEAAKKLGFGSKRTMRLAQDLYEGIDVGGDEGPVGLITYMRTDSSRVSETAAGAARDWLTQEYGEAYLAAGMQLYPSGKANAQDAHEGVRPTDPTRRPDDRLAKKLTADQFKLYELIWKRFMASQMAPAVFDTTTVDFDIPATSRAYLFRATGSVIKFDGFLALYREAREEGDAKALEDEQALPFLELAESVPVKAITPTQHFTAPPPRFSEASLVKELERLGIGRPSTYASIISVLAERRYVSLEQRRFFPTPLGETVERVMVKKFPDIFNVQFTAQMEGELDKIADGELSWVRALTDFWTPFQATLNDNDLDALIGEAYDLSALATEKCPDCGGKLVAKGGFFGPFVACENHPKACKYTRPIKGEKKPAELTKYMCQECGEAMVVRHGRSGDFLGCSKFPKCRGTRSMPTGVQCPKDGGEIAERRSKKRGKAFYGCENYPNCDFVVWDKPVAETCPECGYVGAESKSNKTRGAFRKCLKCANEWDVPSPDEAELVAEVA
ncbi:MAG: type I DNA topoisomerase [Gemmatimonadota bacterium]|nr:type I DNA topoisomerase [Gemmatimonadota bacterium]MDQ8167666.1 type I DNA topoisomerase [Gemmatimonadota bacterium]MDQ8172974.1 type I DNA topoisomerase [Gemmatimonadota bacterium]